MLFNSIQYALFLPIVWVIYWRLKHRRQLVLLLGASYVFYGAWDYRFLSLIVISTVVDFIVGRQMHRTEDGRRRKQLLMVSVAVNLGILGFFKYFNFFVDSAVDLLGGLGLAPDPVILRILLPVGISFYTFQTLSYTIDIYRKRLTPSEDLLTFAVFVAYFPQLVAGPIERAARLLPALSSPRVRPTGDSIGSGLSLIALGLFKKVVIGDVLAPKVDDIFLNADTYGWLSLLIGVYGFTIQLYADFSGYSDMARGSSRLLGIELVRNFDQPYLSRNFSEFWTRWHISLSEWLRDYLYISLGGNRKGNVVTQRNLMITMLLGGLWHGAGINFVVWGALHGAYLVVQRIIGYEVERDSPLRIAQLPAVLVTVHLWAFSMIFFRAPDLSTAWTMIEGILTLRSGGIRVETLPLVLLFAGVIVAIDLAQRRTDSHTPWLRPGFSVPAGVIAAVAVGLIIMAAGAESVPFAYFQF